MIKNVPLLFRTLMIFENDLLMSGQNCTVSNAVTKSTLSLSIGISMTEAHSIVALLFWAPACF